MSKMHSRRNRKREALSKEERNTILYKFNNTKVNYPKDKTIHQLFEEQVKKTPDKIAIVFNNKKITYSKLSEEANKLASVLREKGVRADSVVAIILERSEDMIISILATLKAGGAYLPVEPSYPLDRINVILSEAGAKIVIMKSNCTSNFSYSVIGESDCENPNIIITNKRKQITDLDGIQYPDRSLVDYNKYKDFIGMAYKKDTIAIQATRGCPYQCLYCHKIWPKKHVVRTAENIFEEVFFHYKKGKENFVILDDIFNLNSKNCTRFYDLIIQNKLDITLSFPNGIRGDLLTFEQIDKMVMAGAIQVSFALETASERLQELIGKNLNLTKLYENIKYLTEKYRNVMLDVFLMVGFPTETEEEAFKTLEFIQDVKWFHFPSYNILKIYPNTDMEKLALDNGVSKNDIKRSLTYAYHEIPDTLPFKKSFVKKLQAKFLNEYFLNKERLRSILEVQKSLLTDDEIVQKYNSYLPNKISHINELWKLAAMDSRKVSEAEQKPIPNINIYSPENDEGISKIKNENAARILLIDLSQLFNNEANMLYDVAEPPLGLMYLLTYLDKMLGNKILGKISKSRFDFKNYEELKQIITSFKPDLIGIRTLTFYKDFFHKTISIIRSWGIDVPIIAGGPYATSDYETILKDRNVNLVVLGEGEYTFLELTKKFIENKNKLPTSEILKKIDGIAFIDKDANDRIAYNNDILYVDQVDYDHLKYKSSSLENINKSSDLAYIMFTSGSTGTPKGVMVEHKNVVRLVKNTNYIKFNTKDKLLLTGSSMFDATTFEILGSLTNGITLHLANEETLLDANKLREYLNANSITIMWLTSPLFNQLSEQDCSIFNGLKTLLVGGDVLSTKHINRVRHKCKKLVIINGYGPTENTTFSTYYRIKKDFKKNIPIGKPISNSTAYIVDENKKLVPIGIVGELWVGGDGVARGYLNNEELTRKKFGRLPFSKDNRVYRTGDLARWLPDGNIEFLGRVDNQVKIRGFRIEINEIENILCKHGEVGQAHILVKNDSNGSSYLCAYITAKNSNNNEIIEEIKDFLKKQLPDYMIPAQFVKLKKLPLTSNGKIDRESLIKTTDEFEDVYVESMNTIEKNILKVWREVLCVNTIGLNTNFFEIGGHSLNAMTLVLKLRKEFKYNISIAQFFKTPTVKGIGEYIQNSSRDKCMPIEQAEKKEYYYMSPAQKRMYTLNQFINNGIAYNNPFVIEIKGDIDIIKLQEVFQKLINRHASLRTCFVIKDETPVQKVVENIDFKIKYNEFEEKNIGEIINRFVRPFDLTKAPLLRTELVKINEQSYVLLLDVHHIIMDGVSLGIFMKEISLLYSDKELEPLKIQYHDYSVWQNKICNSALMRKQKKYWLEVLKGELPVLNIRTDYERPKIQTFDGNRLEFFINDDLTKKLNEIVKTSQSTTYMFLLACYTTFLYKYSGEEDIIVGSPIAGRPHDDLKNTIGMFVNTLAMRNYPKGDKRFIDYLDEVKTNSLKAYENQDYPFDELFDKLDIRRDVSRNPLFDTMFSMNNFNDLEFGIEGLSFKIREHDFNAATFDLTLTARERDEKIYFDFEYCSDLFKKETIQKMVRHFTKVVMEITNNPNIKLSEINILADEEKELLLNQFNKIQTAYPKDRTMHQLFEDQATRCPDKTAILCGNKKISYGELSCKSDRIASCLQKQGVKSNTIVGLVADRSIDTIIGILGILKAGGVYLPIDPNYPEDRLKYIIEDSKLNFLLTKSYLNINCPSDIKKIFIDDDSLYKNSGRVSAERLSNASDIAYIIYTSGTTGKPKGVLVTHSNLISIIYSWIEEYKLNEMDVKILQLANFSFDVSIGDVARALTNGGMLVIASDFEKYHFDSICSLINKNNINIIESTPALVSPLFDHIYENNLKIDSLKILIVGSDAFPVNDYIRIKKNFKDNFRIINSYGVTEATIDSSYYEGDIRVFSECLYMPIGKPMCNVKIYVLDKDLKLLPINHIGELCIGGDGVALGYLNMPELTQSKFIANPYVKGERIYRTGDLAKWLPDGNIEFLGRADGQIKLRGYRIETDEIEKKILEYENIKETVIILKDDANGNKMLCAFIVLHNTNTDLSNSEIRDFLLKKLPDYMIPSYFIKLDKLPLTHNGKVDRKALLKFNINHRAKLKHEAPTNSLEEKLVKIWKEILKINDIGINDNFFEIGGHSLKVISLVIKIQKELNIELPLRFIFTKPTIKEIAQYIKTSKQSVNKKITKVEEKEFYPLSSAQKRLYVIDGILNGDVAYNMPSIFSIEGDINLEKLEAAFNKLIKRHEALRTSFVIVDGEPLQKIHLELNIKLEHKEINRSDIASCIDGFVRRFDLGKSPLIRVLVLKIINDGSDSYGYIMAIDMHHIISDAVSLDIIMRELSQLYDEKELEPIDIQYKDYSVWQNDIDKTNYLKSQEGYWLNVFCDEIPILNMPTDFARPSRQSFEGYRIDFESGNTLAANLAGIAEENSITMYMLLLSCYTILLSKYSGQEDVIVGSPIAGRSNSEAQKIVGMFVNTLVMRNYPTNDKYFRDYLNEVKENSLKAYENQDYQFDELVKKLNLKRDLSRNALFSTMFVFESPDDFSYKLNGIELKNFEYKFKISKFDLTLYASESAGNIKFSFEYCTKLFKKSTILKISKHFINILENITKNPSVRIGEIDLLDKGDKESILYDFNKTNIDYPKNKTIHELFEKQVEKTPYNIAASFDGKKITYKELNEKANVVARLLLKKGINNGEYIGIMTQRGFSMIIGMLGILKAGGAYIPIDPDYPESRKIFIIKNANIRVILTDQKSEKLDECNLIDIENKLDEKSDKLNNKNLNIKKNPRELAYIIYTSGSTGTPKGVMIRHHSVVNLINWVNRTFHVNEKDKLLFITSMCFDLSVYDVFGILSSGGEIVIAKKEEIKAPDKLCDIIKDKEITFWDSVPSTMGLLIDAIKDKGYIIRSLRLVFLSGDWILVNLPDKIKQYFPNTSVVSLGGATEGTVWSIYYPIKKVDKNWSSIPYGKPIDNNYFYILDNYKNPVPYGTIGELYIGGDGVAEGYLNDSQKTAISFLSNKFVRKEKSMMYKTGDLGRFLPDGNIEFMGRIDNQVKIRGFRIELGEIEAALLKHDDIKEAIVTVRNDNENNKYLCAYIVPNKKNIDNVEFREFLAKQLPDYMIPTHFVKLRSFPLTTNGKLDKKALPEPIKSINEGRKYDKPQNEIEKKLISIWENVLNAKRISINDDFFGIGGDSLKSIKLVTKINSCVQNEITLSDIYKFPTVKKLAQKIRDCRKSKSDLLVLLSFSKNENKASLVCVPYGGGDVNIYRNFAKELNRFPKDYYKVYSLNLPGHNYGRNERLPENISELAYACFEEIKIKINTPIILYGHCAGTALTLELARILEKNNYPVEAICIGAQLFCNDDFKKYPVDNSINLSNEKIFDELKNLGGQWNNLDNDELNYIIKILKHDTKISDEYYKNLAENNIKLKFNCPIYSIVGDMDASTYNYKEKYKEWYKLSNKVKLFVIKDAKHYFIQTHPYELAEIIKEITCG